MKLILCLMVLVSFSTFAKTKIDFSQALNEDVEQDIRKDDEKFKKEATRGPASVQTEQENPIMEPPKIDKNVRQIGPNKW
jgi:hypothetical protein